MDHDKHSTYGPIHGWMDEIRNHGCLGTTCADDDGDDSPPIGRLVNGGLQNQVSFGFLFCSWKTNVVVGHSSC